MQESTLPMEHDQTSSTIIYYKMLQDSIIMLCKTAKKRCLFRSRELYRVHEDSIHRRDKELRKRLKYLPQLIIIYTIANSMHKIKRTQAKTKVFTSTRTM